ncbi:hypothetical protein F4680DRAFT_41512 [Xylaria scruposa]|nr:hypothetical protein F4680DRAFT_41512 [Xylaria scruposa]
MFCPVSPSVPRYTRTPFRSLHSASCTGPRAASPEWIALLVVLSQDRTGRPCWLCTKPPWRAKTVPADESPILWPPITLLSHPIAPAQASSQPARKIIKTPEHISTLPFRSRFPFLNLLPWSFSVRSVLFTNPSLFFFFPPLPSPTLQPFLVCRGPPTSLSLNHLYLSVAPRFSSLIIVDGITGALDTSAPNDINARLSGTTVVYRGNLYCRLNLKTTFACLISGPAYRSLPSSSV